ncbi:transglycosylase SLT domain-containing protein [Acinetobacter baumannii]|nr:transglycosylase SLT domain-containing protein [Acinetobacter baumannii]
MATASLGRLTLDLVARISGYTEPLSRAERETRRSTKAISESFDLASLAVKGFGVVMGGLSVAGVIAYSEKVITAGNDIQKFSKLANASTAQLQYYAKGAETAGISLESFADKMKDMQDRIGDFQQTGGGPLADFFNNIAPRVGVTIQQFQKLSGPEALQLFYNSLEKAGASTNDMKFYMEQIISDSSLLIPLLEKNGQGFKFWGDAAQKAGAIMSDDMVKSLAEAKSNLQLLDLQWQGLQATLVNQVVPVVELVIENWDKIEAGAIALSAVIGTRLALAFVIAGGQAAASLIQYTRYQIALARMAGETITLTTVTRGLGGAMLSLVGGPLGLIALGVQVAIAGGTYYAMTRKTQDATEAFDMQGKSISDLIGHYNGLSRAKQQAFAYDATKDLQNDVEAYSKAREAFYDSAVNIAYGSADSEQAVKAIDDLVAKFKAGSISAEDFANGMVKLGLYTDQQISTTVKFAEKVDLAKSKMDAQKNVVDALKIATDSVNKSQKDQTKTVNDSASAWQNLTEKQRKYIEQVNTDLLRDKYISELVGRGFTPEKANALADAQANTNEGNAYKTPLQQDVIDATLKRYNSKNYTFGKQDLAAIAKVQGIAKANNFAQIESLYGLPKGALAAYVLGESGGNFNAKSPTGATGLFQTTGIFRKEYKLNSRSSIEAQATAVADAIAKGIKEFGSLDKAMMSLNAGIEGTKQYLAGNIGNKAGQMSPSKAKEVAGYFPKFAKYFAGVNDKTTFDDSFMMPTQADILQQNANIAQAAFELSEKRKEVDSQYYSESEKLAKEHQDRIDKITQVYTGTDQLKTKLAQEDVLYKEQVTQLEVSRQQELNQLKAFETDRISQIRESYDEEIRLMQVSTKYVGAERSKRLELLERAKQAEIDAVKREEEERVQSAFESYLNETDIVVNRYKREREEIQKNYQLTKETREKLLQANQMGVDSVLLKNSQKIDDMSYQSLDYVYRKQQPNQAAWTDLENQYYGQQGALNKAYSEQRGGIFSAVDDENERNSQLLAAHEQYLQAKAALDDEYSQRESDLIKSQHENQLSIWGNLLGQAQNTFSQLTQAVKDANGEQSASFKVMFLAQQSFAMGSAYISAVLAASQVAADATIPFFGAKVSASKAMLAMGMMNVGLIASQALAGMAHNGIDNIPREGTWLLDGGERVLNPQQNKDLTNYLNQRQSAGSGVNVVINNYGNDKVQTSTGPDGSLLVEIGKMVDGAVDRGIQRNMKQGFPLDRAFQRK